VASSKRVIRRVLEHGFLATGAVLVLTGSLVADDPASRTGLTLIGLVLLLLAAYDRRGKLLPSERRLPELRAEVDGFLAVVRRLSAAAHAGYVDTEGARQELVDRARVIGEMADRPAEVRSRPGVPVDV
jgi:hypothetical protein